MNPDLLEELLRSAETGTAVLGLNLTPEEERIYKAWELPELDY